MTPMISFSAQGRARHSTSRKAAREEAGYLLGSDAAIAVGQYRIAGTNQSGIRMEHAGISAATYVRESGKWKIRMQTAIPKPPETTR
jgi:hypothetical protein